MGQRDAPLLGSRGQLYVQIRVTLETDAPLLGSRGQLYLQIRVTLETDAPTTRKSAPLRRGDSVGGVAPREMSNLLAMEEV